MPGPFLNIAAFFGVLIAHSAGASPLTGVAVCWLGILLPTLLHIVVLTPFWGRIRSSTAYARALPGLHAAGAGLILMPAFRIYHTFRCNPALARRAATIMTSDSIWLAVRTARIRSNSCPLTR